MEYLVSDYGAVGDGKRLNTTSIQKAIDAAMQDGGGLVVIPKGTFLSGAIFLKKGVSLRVDGTLLGSSEIKDYPMGKTRFEGHEEIWPCALVNMKGLEDAMLFGKGVIDGNGIPFYKEFWEKRDDAISKDLPFVNKDVPRPRLVYIHASSHVVVDGLSLVNSGFWNLHLYDCHDVVVSHIRVESPHEGEVRGASTDGIDIDMCHHVVVTDSYFEVDDDCICIKGGKGRDACKLNEPTRDILIQRCEIGFGHGAVTFGSEACRVENVTVRNLKVSGENQLVRFKFREDTEQWFRHIIFDSITMTGGVVFAIRPWVSRQDEVDGSDRPSVIDDLVVRHVKATKVIGPGCILSRPPSITISSLRLEHIDITTSGGKRSLSRHDSYESEGATDSRRLESSGVTEYAVDDMRIDGKAVRRL